MKNLFNDISQEERNRILEMHQSATRKNYLSEQTPAPAPAPAAAPAGVPKGPVGGVTKKPAVVPGGDKPQGSAGIYKQIDVATFNKEFLNCWYNNSTAGRFAASEVGKYPNGSSESHEVSDKTSIRNSMFGLLNNFYLKQLTKPMNTAELDKLWSIIAGYKINYSKIKVMGTNVTESVPASITFPEAIKIIYLDEKQMKADYLNMFNCAIKSTQGSQPTQGT
jgi:hypothetical protein